MVLQKAMKAAKVSCLVRDRTRLKAPRDHPGIGVRKNSMMNFSPTTNEMMLPPFGGHGAQ